VKALLRGFLLALAAAIVGYFVWDRVEAHRLASDISAIAARGEPVDLSSLDAPLPTPQHVEAAQLYADAAARAREISQRDLSMTRLDVDAVVGKIDVPELEETYRKDAPALQLLDRATTLPFAGFGDTIDGPDWVNVSGLQALSALSALRSDLLAYRGDGDAAVRSLIAAIGVQRTFVDLFTRSIVAARQFGSLRILLRHATPSAASLEALQRAFANLPDEDGLARDLMLRRARLIEQQSDRIGMTGVSKMAAFAFHPFLTRWVRLQIEQFPEVIAAAREDWPDKVASLSTLEANNTPGSRNPLRNILSGRPVSLAAQSANPFAAGLNLAIRRVAIAALAVERYRRAHDGALPPSLDALVPTFLTAVPIDPFTGRPLVYKPGKDSYLLYSADINRNDDGGALYGTGSLNPMPRPRLRDFGIKVPLAARPGAQ
jgi:hypothetical protein